MRRFYLLPASCPHRDVIHSMNMANSSKKTVYFPKFTEKIVDDLGEYLGDKKCVALTTDKDDFNFETSS